MSSDSMVAVIVCGAALLEVQGSPPDARHRGGAQHGALWRLRCPCRSLVRSDAAPPTIAEGALAPNNIAFDVRGESFDGEPQAVVARLDSVVTCTSFRCTRRLIWTTTSTKSTHHGVRSSTLVTTCLETVVPVNGGTFSMKIFQKSCDCTRTGRHPWTTKCTQSTILGTRRLTPLSPHDRCL